MRTRASNTNTNQHTNTNTYMPDQTPAVSAPAVDETQNDNTFDLARDATLIRIRTKGFSWSKKDKVAAKNAADAENAEEDAFSAYAKLCPDDFKEIRLTPGRVVAEVRALLNYPFNAKWDSDGNALVLNIKLEDTLRKLAELRAKFFGSVDALCAELPNIESAAKVKLNGAYDRLGFPCEADIRAKFGFEIEQNALPDASDVRLRHCSPAAVEAVRKSVQTAATKKLGEINKAVVGEIEKSLGRVVDGLSKFTSGESCRFENTLITDLEAMVENLPALNVTGDRGVEAAVTRSRELLSGLHKALEEKTLRDKNEKGVEVRTEIVKTAGSILDKLKAGAVKATI